MPTGVYVRSAAHRKKIGDRTRGKKRPPRSEEWCRKIAIANTGKKNSHTPEWNEKISKALKGKTFSPERIEQMRITSTGKHPSPEAIAKRVAKIIGRRASDETKQKIAAGRLGENNPYWKGGISSKPGYQHIFQGRRRARLRNCEGSHTLEEWEQLKVSYGLRCPCCQRAEPDIVLTKDHIVPMCVNGSNDIGNIQPLCRSCNSKKRVTTVRYPIVTGTPV